MRGFDMAQAELAERIRISQNDLSTMERGKVKTGPEILLRINRELVYRRFLDSPAIRKLG